MSDQKKVFVAKTYDEGVLVYEKLIEADTIEEAQAEAEEDRKLILGKEIQNGPGVLEVTLAE